MAAMGDEAKFYAEEELVASAPSRKNWRGMLIAIFVICVILGLIITAVIFMTPPDDGPHVRGARFTLDDVLEGRFKPVRFNGTWLSDEELLTTDGNLNLQILHAPSGTFRPLLSNESIPVPVGAKYSISSDGRFLMLSTNHERKPGQSETFLCTAYDLSTGTVYPIPFTSPDERLRVQAAMWSPRNSAVVYVLDNDIYYVSDVTVDQAERLTSDGSFNSIYNGIPDWTYRDILKQPALWFSKNGDRLVYITFNDTSVPEIKLPIYSEPDSFHLYTEEVIIRYPTPSSPIPRVSLRVIDVADKDSVKELRPPLSLRDQEYYLTVVKWVNDERICAVWTTRSQNISLISFCDAGPWHCQTVSTIETGLRGWRGLGADLHFHPDGNSFVHLAPVQIDQGKEYYTNIVMVDASKRHSRPVTQIKTEIHELLGWDVKRNLLYYAGSSEEKSARRQIFKAHINGTKVDNVECLSCSIFARHLLLNDSHGTRTLGYGIPPPASIGHFLLVELKNGVFQVNQNIENNVYPRHIHANSSCHYSQVLLSPSMDFYVHECLGPSIPYVEVRSLPANKLVKLVQTNTQLRNDTLSKALPLLIKLRVPLDVDNAIPWKRSKADYVMVELYLPPGLKEDDNLIYPLIVWTADEPSSQTITDEWKVNWASYMASGRDVVVARVDLHGSQSNLHRNSIYRQPDISAADLIQLTKKLQATFPYISPIKTALVGAHFGGFLSIYTLANDPVSVFGCAVAISPISSWQSLAAPYAEQYLGLLNDREGQQHYFESDLSTSTRNLHGKEIFVLHGTLEEKYPMTHSMLFTKAMIKKRFAFQQQLFPDADYETMQRSPHMYESIDKFLNTCFDRREMPERDLTLHKGGD